jgi:phosphatidylglycerol lysyltransferase
MPGPRPVLLCSCERAGLGARCERQRGTVSVDVSETVTATVTATATATEPPRATGWTTVRRLAKPVLTVVMFVVMIGGLRRLLGTFDERAIVAAYERTPVRYIAAAFGLLAVQYAMYVVRELMAVRFAEKTELSPARVALASLVSRSLSSLGLATITGFALRLRLYEAWGLTKSDVTRLTLYNETTVYIGQAVVIAVIFSFVDLPPLVAIGVTIPAPKLIGAAAAAIVVAYVALSVRRHEPWHIRSFELPPVRGQLLAAQIILPIADTLVAAGIVWTLLPASAGLNLGETAAACFLGGLVGTISQVPGGLGVFETVVLQFIPPSVHAEAMAALLIRRVIVTLVPVAVGTLVLVVYELLRRGPVPAHSWPREIAATAMAATTFASGVLLMVASSYRTRGPMAELGHFAHALMFFDGVATLFVARGLHLQRRRSWRYAMILFSVRALIAMFAGPDLVAVFLSLALVALLLASRRAFQYAPGPRDDDSSWLAAFVIAVAGVTWLSLVAERRDLAPSVVARGTGLVIALALAAWVGTEQWRKRRQTKSV